MKKLLTIISLLAILNTGIQGMVFAKGGSGGSNDKTTTTTTTTTTTNTQSETTTSESTPESEPETQEATAPEPSPTPEETAPETTTKAEPEPEPEPEPVPVTTTIPSTTPSSQRDEKEVETDKVITNNEKVPEPSPTITNTQKSTELSADNIDDITSHCGLKKSIKERVECRFTADYATLKYEQDFAYNPEACRTGSSTWQENCKKRYKKINTCWYDGLQTGQEYNATGVIDCLKTQLELPKKLIPLQEFCRNKEESCTKQYRESVYHLIAGRFYDAEERAELLMKEGKLTQEATIDFITFISESKIQFYSATNKQQRIDIIKSVNKRWSDLIQTIN